MSQVVASYETVWPSGWNSCAMKGTNSAKPGPATLLWKVPRHALSEGLGVWADPAAGSPSERANVTITSVTRRLIISDLLAVAESASSHIWIGTEICVHRAARPPDRGG